MRRARINAVALAAALALALSPAATLAAAPVATESYATMLSQIDAKKGDPKRVIAATIDKVKHHVRLTLADNTRPLVTYPASDDKALVDTLLHHHVHVVYAKKPAVHHTLRYIAAGVVVVLLLIGAGVWVYTRGQSRDDGVTGPKQAAGGPEPDAPLSGE